MEIITDLGPVINEQEISTLSELIKNNNNLWTHESVYWGKHRSELPINFLGSPVYPAKAFPTLYFRLRNKSNRFLIDNTTTMLQRTLNLINQKFGCSAIEQIDDSSLPGFHVFHSTIPCTQTYDYHQDADYLEFYKDFDVDTKYDFNNFFSFTVAIELPVAGATIDFKLENETFSHPYTAGHAYMWKSDIWHKIGDVSLNGDDYRITFQGHLIVHSNKLLYYW